MATVGMMAYPVRNGFQAYPQHYAMYPTRAQHPHMDVAQTMNVNPYAAYTQVAQQQHPQQQPQSHVQPYSHVQPRSPAASASPTSDDGFKPSLPSISNLLSFADRPGAEGTQSSQAAVQQQQQQQQQQKEHVGSSQQTSPLSQVPIVQSNHPAPFPVAEITSSPRDVVPPPPAMRSDSILESSHSPSTISTESAMSASPSYYVGNTINNLDATDQRVAQFQVMKRAQVPSQLNSSPYGNARYTSSPYASTPNSMPEATYYPSQPTTYSVPQGLYHQRPLPSNFPPAPPAVQVQSSAPLPTSNPWEHHHYISPSSQATFPQSQDRYICTTCNKAFSRPSSLKIHTHSHTGEKPFRCPHSGCGKAFSVRSNMKRHERGCHSGMAGHIAHPHLI